MWNNILKCAVLVAIIRSSVCIECYSCVSKENPDCVDPEKHQMNKVKCGLKGLSDTKRYAEGLNQAFSKIFQTDIHEHVVPLNCLKQVTRVQGEDIILRGCQLPNDESLNICKKVYEMSKTEIIDIRHCSLCETDGCNSANTNVKRITALKLIAVFIITAFQNIF